MWEEEIMDKDRIVIIAAEGPAPQLWNLEVFRRRPMTLGNMLSWGNCP